MKWYVLPDQILAKQTAILVQILRLFYYEVAMA